MTDPLARFREWQEEAVAAGVTLPEAMTLATYLRPISRSP